MSDNPNEDRLDAIAEELVVQNSAEIMRAEGDPVEPQPLVIYLDGARVIIGFVTVDPESRFLTAQMADPHTMPEFVFDMLENVHGEFTFGLPRKLRIDIVAPITSAADGNLADYVASVDDEKTHAMVEEAKGGFREEATQEDLANFVAAPIRPIESPMLEFEDTGTPPEQSSQITRNLYTPEKPWGESIRKSENINLDDIGER